MSTYTIDGFNFDLPLNIEQIKALAKFHRDQLHDSLYHKNDKVGNIGIAQRTKILSFTKALDANSQHKFYDVYNTELKQLSVLEHQEHTHHHEKGVNPVLLIIILACLATTLYFVFVHHIVPTT